MRYVRPLLTVLVVCLSVLVCCHVSVCVSCRACRDVFCGSCSSYRLLCRDVKDPNAITQVRVCRSCFSKHRNDKARTPKRNSTASAAPTNSNTTATKPTAQTISYTTLATKRVKSPKAATTSTRTAQPVARSTPPPAVPAPRRNPQLDKQIAQLNDDESGGKKPVLSILRREAERDDKLDTGEVGEDDVDDDEEEEGEEGEEEYEEEEEEEEEEAEEGTATNQSVIEEGEEAEEEEEGEDEDQEGEQEIMNIPTDSLASVKHATEPSAPTPRTQQRAAPTAPTQTVSASTTTTVTAASPRMMAPSNKETPRPATTDKETARVYSTFEGKGEERLIETTDTKVTATPRSVKQASEQANEQTAQQVMPIVQSSEYSKKPPTPRQPAPSSPPLRQQPPPPNTQVETPRSTTKAASTPRSSITPQAAKVFAALARSATPKSDAVPSMSAAPAPSTAVTQQSTSQTLSGSVIVPSWPPVAEDHAMALRGHVVEASTVHPVSSLIASAEAEDDSATVPADHSRIQQSMSPTATGQVAAPPPAFASSKASATAAATADKQMQQRSEQRATSTQTQPQHRPAAVRIEPTTEKASLKQPPTAHQPHPIHSNSQPPRHPAATPAPSPYELFLQPVPLVIAVLTFFVLCAVLPLVYTVPATLVLATSVPLLYSWLWQKKRQAEQEPAFVVGRDFPQLVEVHEQLVEERRREQFERDEASRLSEVLPSPTLAKDYASQCVITDGKEDEEDERQEAQRAKLVV